MLFSSFVSQRIHAEFSAYTASICAQPPAWIFKSAHDIVLASSVVRFVDSHGEALDTASSILKRQLMEAPSMLGILMNVLQGDTLCNCDAEVSNAIIKWIGD